MWSARVAISLSYALTNKGWIYENFSLISDHDLRTFNFNGLNVVSTKANIRISMWWALLLSDINIIHN